MKMHLLPLCSFISTVTASFLSFSTSASGASFTGLGDLDGGSFVSWAEAISADGSTIVGGSSSAYGIEAFRWTASGGMIGLGALCNAYGVSGDGSVVVGRCRYGETWKPLRWTSDGGMLDIGDLPGGGILGYANGVSGDGSVVVGESWSGSGGTEAFYWTENDGMVGLGNLSGRSFGGFFSSAFGISADGLTIVGDSQSPDGNDHVAFRWTKSDGMISLGYLPGGSASYARAISANGSVIVGFGSGYEAFRWTQHTGMVGLGTLPDGFSSYAKAASADGSVVVGMSNTTSGDKLFIWDSLSGMRNLSDVLSNELGLGDSLSGWSLQNVTGISSDGLTIVGYGINPMGRQEAWMARLQGLRATAGGPYLVALGNAIQLNGKCILPDTNETPSFLWAPAEHLDDATLSSPTYTTHALTTPSIEALTLTCEDSEPTVSG